MDDSPTPSRTRAQAASLGIVAHRPYALPRGPWIMGQTWEDLLFAHWRVDPAALRALVDPRLELDTFDGAAWLGVVPFDIRALRPRWAPPLLDFPELNVRTYVTRGGRPGVYFFSLDAGSRAAVHGARLTYRLPYFHAAMAIERRAGAGAVRYRSRRRGREWEAEYAPAGPAFNAAPGTLEHFLTERYCLYAVTRRRVLRAEIHHAAWPLQPAEARIARNTMAPVALPGAPLLHFAARQDVVVWAPREA